MYKIEEVSKVKFFNKLNSVPTKTVVVIWMLFFIWLEQRINNPIGYLKSTSVAFAFLSLSFIALIIALLFSLILKIGKVNVKLSQITGFTFFLMAVKPLFDMLETLIFYFTNNKYICICIEISFLLLCCVLIYFFFSNNLNTTKILSFTAMVVFVVSMLLISFGISSLINIIRPKEIPLNDYDYSYNDAYDKKGNDPENLSPYNDDYDYNHNREDVPVDYDSIAENMK